MLNWNILQELLVIASINSTICVAFIQKIKRIFSCSKCIPYYSFAINIVLAIVFCISFTNIKFPTSLWVGFFGYIGADSIYKTLEGKLKRYSDLAVNNKESNLVNSTNDNEDLEVITYE